MDSDLERPGVLGRFAPPVEREYASWLSGQIRPLATVIAILSLAVWVLLPPATSLFLGSPAPAVLWWVCYGLNAPASAAVVVLARRRDRTALPAAFTLAVLAVVVGSFINPLATEFKDNAPGIAVGNAIFYSILCAFARIPFRASALVTVLASSGAAATMAAMIQDGSVTAHSTWFYWLLLVGSVPVALGAALVGEQTMRLQFAAEKVIARQRSMIQRYVPSAVVHRIEQGDVTVDVPQRRRVTVFFSDVVGFTQLADRLDPEALALIVNQYLGSLAEIVERHGGTLNEFAGDGVMALFGAPEEMEPADQVGAALRTARDLQQALPAWSSDWYHLGLTEDLQTRIGINTGTVSVGTYGSAVRATYTGIGIQTNIAARVQAQCPPGSVLLSNTSWHLIKDEVPCESRGVVPVKGVHYPVEMYEPVERSSSTS